MDGLVAVNDSPTAVGEVTTLTATVGGGSHVVYAWGFGDGETGPGEVVTHTYAQVGSVTAVVTASNAASVLTATTVVTVVSAAETRVITYAYDPLGRLMEAPYSSGEGFEYTYDAVGNRQALTETTSFTQTSVTTYTYDAA